MTPTTPLIAVRRRAVRDKVHLPGCRYVKRTSAATRLTTTAGKADRVLIACEHCLSDHRVGDFPGAFFTLEV